MTESQNSPTERNDECGCSDGRIIGTDPTCMEVHPDGRHICTREPGHEGDHVACSPSEHPKARWSA